ncbi:hypothetical protein K505DRAFT_192396, partial [Melanomma pulvis-pyrius CBS 109.77]
WGYIDILKHLERIHTNPNETRDAQHALYKVKQQDGEALPAYIARILHEAK